MSAPTHACTMCPRTTVLDPGIHPCGCEYINGRFMPIEPVITRYRRVDGTVYASRCGICAKAWKVYQRRACNCPTNSTRYEEAQ